MPATPLKINMEHNHKGLVQKIFLSKWVMAVGEPAVNLPGCNCHGPSHSLPTAVLEPRIFPFALDREESRFFFNSRVWLLFFVFPWKNITKIN